MTRRLNWPFWKVPDPDGSYGPAAVPAPDWRPHRENTMPDSDGDKTKTVSDAAKAAETHDDDRMEDEEKILAGRRDVNYPALLTKDVPGG
jgi:hypothetical protein